MKNFTANVVRLIDSLSAIISLNRCSFSIEDVIHLEDCKSKLIELENDINKTPEEKHEVFIGVVIALDKFFCSGKYLQMLFDIDN